MPLWMIATLWISRLVLVILFALSIGSISIIIDRYRFFKKINLGVSTDEARKLIDKRNWEGLKSWASSAPVVGPMVSAALDAPARKSESVEKSVRAFLNLEKIRLEKGLTALATLGSNAPFIGLFGTVLGIIQAFGALSFQQSNSNSVMAGISEALVATAVGLFVAIPAVIAYNYFARKLRVVMSECESLKDYLISRFLAE